MSINNQRNIDQVTMNLPTIIQWNINGMVNNKEELKLLVQQMKPIMVCLQETNLSPKIDTSNILKNFNVYRADFMNGRIACDGVATLVNKNVYSEQVPINTNLQAIAVKIKPNWLTYAVTVCNIYIRREPGLKLEEKDLTDIYNQLPKPCVMCGDFNSHSRLWGANANDANGN